MMDIAMTAAGLFFRAALPTALIALPLSLIALVTVILLDKPAGSRQRLGWAFAGIAGVSATIVGVAFVVLGAVLWFTMSGPATD